MTQEQFGKAARIDYKHIGAVERGDKVPSFDAIERIAKTLKVDYYELFLPEQLVADEPTRSFSILVREIDRHGSPEMKRFLTTVLAGATRHLESSSR